MEAEEIELWKRYRDSADLQARDFLFVRYTPWATSVAAAVARRLRPGILEWRDHVQNARLGLLEAMSRFDVTRGVDFMAYAKPRVRGAVFNGMRVGAPSDAADARLAASADRLESLTAPDNEDPLSGFIDEVLGLAVGYFLDEGSDPRPDSEHGEVLLDALQELPARQREIVIDHYLRQIPFQTIAQRLKLSKGRVSQIHKEALRCIRVILRTILEMGLR